MQLLRVVLELVELAMLRDRQELREARILDDVDLVFRVLYYAVHGTRPEMKKPAGELSDEHGGG